jgi:hypothetical protein
MAMRFFDVTDVDSEYLGFILKHYGLDVNKLLYHNEYYSMGGINSKFSGASIDIIKSNKNYLIFDDNFTFFDSLYGVFSGLTEVIESDVKLFPTILCRFNKHFGGYYTIGDVYSLFSSTFRIFDMIDDFKDDVRLIDVVYFTKYDSTFSFKLRLEDRDISIFDNYSQISIDEFSNIRNKISTFNSVLSGYYLETKIKDIKKYLNGCVVDTVTIGD